MTDNKELLRQIRELDDHITRLLTQAKEVQDHIRGLKTTCQDCQGSGGHVTKHKTGLETWEPCKTCGGRGNLYGHA